MEFVHSAPLSVSGDADPAGVTGDHCAGHIRAGIQSERWSAASYDPYARTALWDLPIRWADCVSGFGDKVGMPKPDSLIALNRTNEFGGNRPR
jgi:hypothetical protein